MKGLYIHIPFCLQKCSYCDFVSIPCGDALFAPYIGALEREMEQYEGEVVDTVFIGGGTPTVLPAPLLERLLLKINRTFQLAADTEWSVEANPKTLTEEKLSVLKEGGVNRISIGAQSFQNQELRLLGRIHTAQDVYNTMELAKKAGFTNINLDLMSALPGQTFPMLLDSLRQAVSSSPAHISCYSLILEEGTPLAQEVTAGKYTMPDEDTDRMLYENAVRYLREQGYKQYEISNFAKEGYACRHNLKYWDCMPYIGIGAAAHSFTGAERYQNIDDVREYIRDPISRQHVVSLSKEDCISEFMMMGLRKTAGISEAEFALRFGETLDGLYKDCIDRFLEGGFLARENGRLFLTPRGVDVSNSIMCEFLLN